MDNRTKQAEATREAWERRNARDEPRRRFKAEALRAYWTAHRGNTEDRRAFVLAAKDAGFTEGQIAFALSLTTARVNQIAKGRR